MDPVQNPFAPGAGSRPPQLAGRDPIIEKASITLKRIQIGRHAKSQMLLGLRGVGKTVLLNRIDEIASQAGYLTSVIEAPEGNTLAEMLAPHLRVLLFRISGSEKARVLANRAMSSLRSFASVFKVSYGDFEAGVADAETAASGHLETDLSNLMLNVANAAAAAERPVALLIDEVQYLQPEDLRALIAAMHQVSQRSLPLVFFGAGLPQLAGLAGDAKSYAERLFEFPDVGPLDAEASRAAVRDPVKEAGADITDEALQQIFAETEGYPYFLQEWGHHSWDVTPTSPITAEDVVAASRRATAALDASFFRVRFDRLTPREQDYLRAMAEKGAGPHRSGDIAAELRIDVTTAGSLRTGLIRKGMIFSPEHGLTAFTVPMFDAYMRRAIPEWRPQIRAKRRR
ncbi:MAG TPA: ATP-binding protein [Thermoanaerobaculia bacterium]|nr:ATP-binding protein [Thermoanaerobaculia bacterium]